MAVQGLLKVCHTNKRYLLQIGLPLHLEVGSATVPVV